MVVEHAVVGVERPATAGSYKVNSISHHAIQQADILCPASRNTAGGERLNQRDAGRGAEVANEPAACQVGAAHGLHAHVIGSVGRKVG